jgi:hypothetical protein
MLGSYALRARLRLALMSSRVKRRYSTWPAPTSGWIPDEWKTYRRREYRAMSKEERRRERQEREKQEHDDAVERTVSDRKLERADELTKRLKVIAHRTRTIQFGSGNFKKDGQSRRFVELSLRNGVNGVNPEKGGKPGGQREAGADVP